MNRDDFNERLRARAARDAAAFRERFPDATPNEKWIENSFTAAVPLAADDAGIDAGPGPHPEYFAIYAEEVTRHLGMSRVREDGEWDRDADEAGDGPTRGEA